MTFHWQTDDEPGWNDSPPPTPAPTRFRSWPLVLLFIGVLALGGYSIYQQISERVETVSANMRAEVLGSHRLLQRALDERDEEIFLELLSGRVPAWLAAQRQLFLQDGLVDRQALGLKAVSDSAAEIQDVILSPDLEEAEVIATRYFTVPAPDGITATVALDQVNVYRRGEARWLVAPPTAEAWTTWQSLSGDYLDITHIARDGAIVPRLLEALDGDVARLCRSGFSCPAGLRMRVQLDPDPATLVRLDELRVLFAAGEPLVLPAPSLIGLPRDEAGFQALRRSYGARLVAAAITRIEGYACCERAVFLEALLKAHWAQLDLGPPLARPGDYRRALRRSLDLGELYTSVAPYWFRPLSAVQPDEATWRASLLLDFLLSQHPEIAPGSLYDSMMSTRRLGDWATQFVTGLALLETDPALEGRWIEWLAARTGISTSVPSSLMQDNLLALCTPLESPEGVDEDVFTFPHILHAFDPRLRRLVPVSNEPYTSLMPLPAGAGAILQQLDLSDLELGSEQSLVYWHQGEGQPIYRLPSRTATTIQSLAPDGSAVTLLSFPIASGRANQTLLLALGQCTSDDCAPASLLPTRTARWSPDSRQLLLLSSDRQLWLVDRQGQTLSLSTPGDRVFAAAWEDADRILLYSLPPRVTDPGSLQRHIVSTGEREVILGEEDLLATLGRGLEERAEVLYLTTIPEAPERALLAVQTRPTDRFSITFVWLDVATGALTPWMTIDRTLFDQDAAQNFPAGGDAVALMLSRFDVPYGELLWHDMATGRSFQVVVKNWFTPGAYAWSGDGAWLAIARDQYIYLVAPRLREEHLLIHGLPQCNRVAWTGR